MKINQEAFMDDIEQVCRKHGVSISHEDEHGSFVLEPFSEEGMTWLRDAYIDKRYREPDAR